jgi:hypothetical protein
MRFSERYGLPAGQAGLDFVDIDVTADTRLFVDPYPIRQRSDDWATGCVGLLQDFFAQVLSTVKGGNRAGGIALLSQLREPNETHLGFGRSRMRSRGSAVGPKIAGQIWDALSRSKAAHSGLLKDLEEAALLVDHVSIDRVSDICTDVLRRPFIDYTKAQADLHGVPTEQVRSGPLWSSGTGSWGPEEYVQLPVGPNGPLLLIPKTIARQRLTLDPGDYYTHYILPRFRDEEIAAGRALVRVLKDGRRQPYLTKDEADRRLRKQVASQKEANARITNADEALLEQYLKEVRRGLRPRPSLDLEALTGAPMNANDWQTLLDRVLTVTPGGPGATAYHRAVRDLLTALFYPALDHVILEAEIEQGRKRVDLRFTNLGSGGFFAWLQRNYPPQPYVWCECKNYSADLSNEALDQLTGRFAAATRGNFGLLLCRCFDDKPRFVQRCREAASAGRGYVLVLDDDDLRTLVKARQNSDDNAMLRHLTSRFGEIVA